MPHLGRWFSILLVSGASLIGTPAVSAQGQGPSILAGVVTDPSGARIPRASIHIHGHDLDIDTATNGTGGFSETLPGGTYTVTVDAPGFRELTRDTIIAPGQHDDLTLRMSIDVAAEEVSIDPGGSSAEGADALNFSGNQLDMLSDDPNTLRQQLIAMSGAGPGGPQIYVDGFSNGQVPPKSAIRSIRINQNPYSAVFDRAGFGRVEIQTRAGGNKLHGTFGVSGTDNAFNARNPYTTSQPPYHQLFFEGNVNGPIGKKATFFLAGNSTDLQNNAVVNAANPLAPSTILSEAVPNPQRDDDYSLRLDRQLSQANSFNGRYEVHRNHLTNAGVGQLVLPSEGYTSSLLTQTLQLDDSFVLNPKIVSDTRFQYIRTRRHQDPNDTSPSIVVQGGFSAGGAPTQLLRDNQDNYEFQEDLSIQHKTHFIRTGERFRAYRDSSYTNGGFNGQFTFPDVTAYQITEQGLANNETDAQIRATCVTTSTGPVCGGATQFNLTTGLPSASVLTTDLAVYADDEWRLTSRFSLDLGLRYESQTAIPDHNDPAPRFGFAWAIGPKKARAPIVVLRGGAGIFYQRFAVANLLTAVRQNGVNQLAYFVQNPSFFTCTSAAQDCTIPQPATLPASEPTVYRVDPNLRSTYTILTSLTAERTIGRIGSISASYTAGHTNHEFLSINANAPLPDGTRPLGGSQNLYEFTSEGISNGRIFSSNLNLAPSPRLYIWAFYYDQRNYTDASGPASFASNSYNIRQDYGRDVSAGQEIFCGFNWQLPYGFNLSPYFTARDGRPFNITTGTDLNGDTIYNDRPAFATDLSRASVIQTAYGNFDTDPQPGQTIIPFNYGQGSPLVWLMLQAGETFHLGPRPAAGPAATAAAPNAHPARHPDRPWSLNFSLEAQNLFNHNNPGPPVSVLSSPFFGKPISLATDLGTGITAANRAIMLHSTFTF